MCGIVGLLIRDPELEPQVGSFLAQMLASLGERGPDSSGAAIYSSGDPLSDLAGSRAYLNRVRISLASEAPFDWESLRKPFAHVGSGDIGMRTFPTGAWLFAPSAELTAVMEYLSTKAEYFSVVGVGEELSVIKGIGRPESVNERFMVDSWSGDMAIGHTRMATESAVTVRHCHPFVPAPDLCIVHNGSFSNHATVRRRLIAEGVAFDSDNDSEVAARLISRQLALGDDLEEATRWVTKEMDGFFTMIITSPEGMSVVRDPFACKPAVVAETPQYVAVASEYRAIAGLPGIEDATVFEPEPEEVYTWKR